MNYEQYLYLQSRVEWLFNFHPEFFDQITPDQRKALQSGVLYDTSDSEYPKSIQDFYNDTIASNPRLQKQLLDAVQALYDKSGSGQFSFDA